VLHFFRGCGYFFRTYAFVTIVVVLFLVGFQRAGSKELLITIGALAAFWVFRYLWRHLLNIPIYTRADVLAVLSNASGYQDINYITCCLSRLKGVGNSQLDLMLRQPNPGYICWQLGDLVKRGFVLPSYQLGSSEIKNGQRWRAIHK